MIADNLDTLSPEQLRDAVRVLLADVASKSTEIAFKQATIDKLAHEMAVLKRLKFAARSEAFNAEQKSLIEETIDTDLAALALEIEQRAPSKDLGDKQQPKRAVLPPDLPRTEHRHEPADTVCGCGCRLKRIGEDVAEKLDYTPGVFTVERHVRGKWVCAKCETLVQAPVAPHIIALAPQNGPFRRSSRLIRPSGRLDDCAHDWGRSRDLDAHPLYCRPRDDLPLGFDRSLPRP